MIWVINNQLFKVLTSKDTDCGFSTIEKLI